MVKAGYKRKAAGRTAAYKRARGPSKMVQETRAVVRALSKAIETKMVDGYLDETAVVNIEANDQTWAGAEMDPRDVTGTYGCLPMPAPGDGYANRDGRKIFVKKIEIKGLIRWPSITGTSAPTIQGPVRLVVVKDNRSDGSTLSAENVLGAGLGSDGAASLLADAGLQALVNPDGMGRYSIMLDKQYKSPILHTRTDGSGFGDTQGNSVSFSFSVYPKCYVNFDGNTGKIGSIVDKSFHLLAATADAALAGDPVISYVCRTTFVG